MSVRIGGAALALRILLLVFVLCLVVSAVATAAPNYDQSPFGVNYLKWHYFDHPGGLDELRTKMRVMKDAGIYWDRDAFDYGDVHPKPDVWKWDFTDKCVALAKEEKINLIVILMGGPTPRDEATRKAYGEYVYQVVNRYKDYIKIWEIWNEPNIPSFWQDPDAKLYVQLMKVAYAQAKRADPTCTVIVGSTSGPGTDWFNGIFDSGGWDYCDGISIHPYGMASGPIEQGLDESLRLLKKQIASFGKPKPIWTTEVGWQASSPDQEKAQAARIVRTYIIHLANGIQNMAYFCMDDYDNWGFVEREKPLETKLAYKAIATMTKALGSPGKCAKFEGYLKMPEGVACYVFSKSGNERVLFLWSNDSQTHTIPLPQKRGLTIDGAAGGTVATAGGRLLVGPDPIIITDADADKIGTVSSVYNPYLRKPGRNILINPAMDADGKAPHGWSPGRFFGSDNKGRLEASSEGRFGTTCVSISKSSAPAAWDASPIPVDPGKTYTLSAWIKTKDATGRNLIALYWYSGNQWTCLGSPSSESTTGTHDWTKVTVRAKPPRDAAMVRVNLISEDNSGTTWFDDVALTEE